MKRPLAVIATGWIIGIIGGEYLKISTILLLLLVGMICFFLMHRNQKRYIRVFLKRSTLLLFLCSFIVAFFYVRYQKEKFLSLQEGDTGNIIGIIRSNPEKKEYSVGYVVEIERLQGHRHIRFQGYFSAKGDIFAYGDKIRLNGILTLPEASRNEGRL